jgi:hypothetical protein
VRTERLGEDPLRAVLILEEGDSLRCDKGEIPLVIEYGMHYTLTTPERKPMFCGNYSPHAPHDWDGSSPWKCKGPVAV